jgi:uncharacterized BrkB/YihY/UPF0761 family membrane protein
MASSPFGERPTDQPDASPSEISGWQRLLSSERLRLSRILAKHQHRPLVDVALRIYRRDRESAGSVAGSAVAFRLFLFFVPFMLLLVGLLGFIATWVDAEDVHEQTGITGTLAVQIDSALTQPNSSRWLAIVFGLFGVAWAGRSLSKVLGTVSCLTWRLPVEVKASVRIVGGVVGLVTGIALITVIVSRIRADFGLIVAGFSFVAAAIVFGLAWLAVSVLLPRATNDPGALLPGAVIVGSTIAGMPSVSQLYLPSHLARASALYGAIGITAVTLGWFFILGRAMVLAMTLNAVIYERFGTISQAVFALPVLRVLPRKSQWIQRFFDLDTDVGDADR